MSALDVELRDAALEVARGGAPADAAWLRAEARRRRPLATGDELDAAVALVRAGVEGLGPLDPLLADDAVSDVLVNGDGTVWIERDGAIVSTGLHLPADAVVHLVERIVGPLGLRVDRSSPMVDARLPDGSRVNVVLPPLAVDGPTITIRRFRARAVPLEEFAPPPVAALLRWAVRARANVVVSGATGAGKTTLLNALAQEIAAAERVVTVEDAAELRLPLAHVVRLEARPASADGLGAVTIRDLVRNALRMRPDRLLVGEVRGGEAIDMVQAMSTGHDGSLSTCHATTPIDALRRIEVMVLLSGVALPLAAVRAQLGAAVDIVVQVARGDGGRRHVVAVDEVVAGRALGTRRLADATTVLARPTRGQRDAGAPSAESVPIGVTDAAAVDLEAPR